MKNLLIICLALALVVSVVQAEETDADMSYYDALSTIEWAVYQLTSLSEINTDSESRDILEYCLYRLAIAEAGLTLATPQDILSQDKDQFAQDDSAIAEADACMVYSVNPVFIEELGHGLGYKISRRENYASIENTVYDTELENQSEFARIEFAIRPDSGEMMILLTLLSTDLMTNSNRYLVYYDSENIRSLYSRTFGSVIQYRIDLSAWADGTEYQWDEKLLYPKIG